MCSRSTRFSMTAKASSRQIKSAAWTSWTTRPRRTGRWCFRARRRHSQSGLPPLPCAPACGFGGVAAASPSPSSWVLLREQHETRASLSGGLAERTRFCSRWPSTTAWALKTPAPHSETRRRWRDRPTWSSRSHRGLATRCGHRGHDIDHRRAALDSEPRPTRTVTVPTGKSPTIKDAAAHGLRIALLRRRLRKGGPGKKQQSRQRPPRSFCRLRGGLKPRPAVLLSMKARRSALGMASCRSSGSSTRCSGQRGQAKNESAHTE